MTYPPWPLEMVGAFYLLLTGLTSTFCHTSSRSATHTQTWEGNHANTVDPLDDVSLLQTAFAVEKIRGSDASGLEPFPWVELGVSHQLGAIFPESIKRSDFLENLDEIYADTAIAATVANPDFQMIVPESKREQLRMFNPSLFQDANSSTLMIARVSTASRCCGSAFCKNWEYWRSVVSCKNHSGVIECSGPVKGVDDPHAFNMNGKSVALVNIFRPNFEDLSTHKCIMKILDLGTMSSRPVHFPGAQTCEKNWSPFIVDGQLFITHDLSPNHRVLSCKNELDVARNENRTSCDVAFKSEANFSTRGLPDEAKLSRVSGGTPYAELSKNYLVAVAHKYVRVDDDDRLRSYWHSLYAIERSPPFRVVANTPWFQFPVLRADADAEWAVIQYAGGLMRTAGSDHLVVSFGVGDCHSRSVRLQVSDVKRAMNIND